jgi:hypothetical protein
MPSTATVRVGLERATGNFWIDTGLVILAQGLEEGEHEADAVLEWLLARVTQKTSNTGLYYDPRDGQLREYGKTNWTYPTNLFIKVAGAAGKKVTIDGQTYPTRPPAFQLKLDLSKKPASCDICGEHGPVTDAKMWMFPFLVDPSKFANFYPGLKRGAKMCARCALAGLAAYLGWLWKAQGQDALHFFIFHSDLEEMKRLHRSVLGPLRAQGGKGGNAPVAFSGPYIHETVLGLLLQLFSHARSSDVLDQQGREALAQLLGATAAVPPPVTLFAVSGKPAQAFNMTDLREFSRVHDLFYLYERWLKTVEEMGANPHARVVRVFGQFQAQQGKSWETLWRDRIAWSVLSFSDPFPFIEQFLYEVRVREESPRPLVRGTLEVFEQYGQEVMGMDEQFQRTLAGFGHNLGTAAQEHNEMGLLYELRNAKNPEAFYRVLNDAQFRLETTIPEALLRIEKGERIAGVPWVRVKTILAIYAMNAFLRKAGNQSSPSQGREEGQE